MFGYDTKTVRCSSTGRKIENLQFIQYAGSVKKEGNNYFIVGGSGYYCLEINYLTNEKLLRINQKYSSYRALKY
jgi:hypothetical protein